MSGWLGGLYKQPIRAVVVHTQTGQMIRGALVESNRHHVVLRMAALAQQANPQAPIDWQPLAGDIVIRSENVDFMQDGLDSSILGVM